MLIPEFFYLIESTSNNSNEKVQSQIIESCSNELARIAACLSEDDRGNLILKRALEYAHDEANEHRRIVSLQV